MNISSRSSSLRFARTGESRIRATELPPKHMVDIVTTALLPHESKTPRGAPPSRVFKRNVDQMRSGKDTTVQKFLSMLLFRKARGEAPEQVAVTPEIITTMVVCDPNDARPTVEISQREVPFDSQEDVKQFEFTINPDCPRAAAEYLEAAAAEVAAKRPLMARAQRVIEEAR